MGIELIVKKTASEASAAGADIIAAMLHAAPRLSAVLATGNSPMALYAELAARQRAGALDARSMRLFQLDTYLGTGDDDPRSLFGWMKRAVIDPLDIPVQQVIRFPEHVDDVDEACFAFKARISEAGGFDLSVLGLGPNGHLGFNEPPSDADATTRLVPLTPESFRSNAVYWGGEANVPPLSLTVGLDALLAARRTLLLVFGAHKHDILRRTLEGPVSPEVPASFLQDAPEVTILADEAAWTGRT